MTKLQDRLNTWLDSRLDADDMNAVAAFCSVLIAAADDVTLLRAENELWKEGISLMGVMAGEETR